MFKRKSVIITILIVFWMSYSVMSVATYLIQTGRFYEQDLDRRKKNVDFLLDLATQFLLGGNSQGLLARLQNAREIGHFDFFILKKNDQVLGFYNKNNDLQGINYKFKADPDFQYANNVAIKVIQVADYQLMLGIYKAEGTFLWYQLNARKEAIVLDLFMVTVLVFAIVYLLLKDILQISKILQSRSRSELSNIKTNSKEAEILLRAAEGFEQTTRGLKKDNLLLASTLAPAVRMEIKGGKAPPYSIACTVGRVDLNGYTQLVLEKNHTELLQILNEYFRRARDIIERFQGGMIYQYVGDEIVFIFKESEYFQDSTSLQRALSAVRCLFEMADQLKSPSLPKGLKLKSSLVFGELTFVQLDQGYSFSGLPLIETVRMLGQVIEKSENALILYQDAAESLKDFCEISSTRVTVFKGFHSESHLVDIKKFVPIHQVNSLLPPGRIADCFRSDSELSFILGCLIQFFEEGDQLSFFKIIGSLRNLVVDRVNEEVVYSYEKLFGHLLNSQEDQKAESKYLASVLSLSLNLLHSNQITASISEKFSRCEKAVDYRVQANALVAKANFDLDIKAIDKKMSSDNNRIAADAVMIAGKVDFDQNLFERVLDFLESGKPRFQASGLYIIAAMIDYHFERDLVYLKANKHLKTLSLEVKKYLDHENEMVKNRARLSQAIIEKVGVYAN